MGIIKLLILILTLVTNVTLMNALVCSETSKPCNRNSDCCDGCCFEEVCTEPEKCGKDINPCSTLLCPPTTVCNLQKVQCFRAPCAPLPSCEPIDGEN